MSSLSFGDRREVGRGEKRHEGREQVDKGEGKGGALQVEEKKERKMEGWMEDNKEQKNRGVNGRQERTKN